MTRPLIIASLLLLAGCETLKKLIPHRRAKDDKKTEAGQVLIGAIELVNPDQHFVLIRTIANFAMPADTELTATNERGQTSKLKVTPERKGSFLAADIVSGSPQKEDTVTYQSRSASPPALPGGKPERGEVTDMPIQPLPALPPPTSQPLAPPGDTPGAIPLQPAPASLQPETR